MQQNWGKIFKIKFAKILVFATLNPGRRLKMGDRGEPGNVTDRLLKLAYGGEDVDQMFDDAEQLNALRDKFGVDAQTLEAKIFIVMETLNLDRQNAISFLTEVKVL